MMLTQLHKRILEISYKKKLSHIGSNISAVDIIDEIYSQKKDDEIFLLGAGHYALSLYIILEKYYGYNAEELFDIHGVHCNQDLNRKIYISSGSLGLVEPIACGFALADRSKKVYLLSSDGGSFEENFLGALRFKRDHCLNNLIWHVNINGYSAYDKVNFYNLGKDIHYFCKDVICHLTDFKNIPFLKEIDAHYKVLDEKDWEWIQNNTN